MRDLLSRNSLLSMLSLAVFTVSACDERKYEFKTEREWRKAFQSGTLRDRVWAAGALAGMEARSVETRQALLVGLEDSSQVIKVAAAMAIAQTDESRIHRDYILLLLWRAAGDTRSEARVAALEALGLEPYRDRRSVPVLIAALRDPWASTRLTAAASLRQLGSRAESGLEALHAALRDTSEVVRHEVRDAITAISGQQLQHR